MKVKLIPCFTVTCHVIIEIDGKFAADVSLKSLKIPQVQEARRKMISAVKELAESLKRAEMASVEEQNEFLQ